MTRHKPAKTQQQNRALPLIEAVLFVACVCVLVIRTTFAEGPPAQSPFLPANLNDTTYSLAISTILIASFVIYVLWNICTRSLKYRPAGIELALLLFLLAAVISGLTTSDKRAAITYTTVLVAPLLMALLLLQFLNSPARIRLLLAIITALGAVNACQAIEQFSSTNQMTIQQYEEDPKSVLEPLGIEQGTLNHFLFEHRIYSRGVRAYFTTRNSAGSFFLLSLFAALALLTDKLKNRKTRPTGLVSIIAVAIITALILFALILTRSKGAGIGLSFALFALIFYHRFGGWLSRHRKFVLAACLTLALAGAALIAGYGLAHGRLPGGNSTLVRWQYWHASAQMCADHPFTGVGPGNFGGFYPKYKPPAAPESVADPHNLILSILTQFGPLGLIAFAAMLALPLARVTRRQTAEDNASPVPPEPGYKSLLSIVIAATCITLLLIRPALTPTSLAGGPIVILYIVFSFYITPAAVFLIAFFMATVQIRRRHDSAEMPDAGHRTPPGIAPILFCALIAVVIHAMIDFAMFEPPVFTVFCALLACLLAIHHNSDPNRTVTVKSSKILTLSALSVCLVGAFLYLTQVFYPVVTGTASIARAKQAMFAGNFELGHHLLARAEEEDPLSPAPPATNARFYLRHFEWVQSQEPDILLKAEQYALSAIQKDPASYKNYERLTEIYCRLAELPTEQAPRPWQQKALESATNAVQRYPGSARLHLDLAQVAEQLGDTNLALTHYKRTVEIENAYRQQFKQMYPNHPEVVSRLGNDQYQFATQKLQQLASQ